MAQVCELFEDATRALEWWAGRERAEPTSSLTGGGAIAELERTLAAIFGGYALALPSGTSALIAGLRCIGADTQSKVTLSGRHWRGIHGVVEALRTGRASADAGIDVVIASGTAALEGAPLHSEAGTRRIIVDAADLAMEHYGSCRDLQWDALALSFGPGKAIDGGEGGALIVRDLAAWRRALQMTQHPIRQMLSGVDEVRRETACERIHPVAALLALHRIVLDASLADEWAR